MSEFFRSDMHKLLLYRDFTVRCASAAAMGGLVCTEYLETIAGLHGLAHRRSAANVEAFWIVEVPIRH